VAQEKGQALQFSLETTKVDILHALHKRVEALVVILTDKAQSMQEGSAVG
jgi:hypothetical protein